MTRAAHNARAGRSSKWIRREKRLAIYQRDGHRCCYCGTDLRAASPKHVHLDHLRPRVRGGSNEATNLVTACGGCNDARQDRSWRAFARQFDAVARIERQRRRVIAYGRRRVA